MARASRPAMPSDDIDAARAAGGALAAGGLSPGSWRTSARAASASSSAPAAPTAGRWRSMRGAAGSTDRGVRVLVQRGRCAPALDALAARAGIAVTFSRPTDHRSIQLKAPGARASPRPMRRTGARSSGSSPPFAAALAAVGYLPSFLASFTATTPRTSPRSSSVPEEAFVQTPGPGAGSALR